MSPLRSNRNSGWIPLDQGLRGERDNQFNFCLRVGRHRNRAIAQFSSMIGANMKNIRTIAFALLLFAAPALFRAQSTVLNLPRPSQHAALTQRIGITDITINYHSPIVNGRKVWGGLVPYGHPWRAGANENTTIA